MSILPKQKKLSEYLHNSACAIEKDLKNALPPSHEIPEKIHEAMHYSIFAGGKRIRPILCLETAKLISLENKNTLIAACSLEMIHTYSLIHDDLPSMDNDVLRRGKATCHIQYDEATAILAGDALLTYAFDYLSHKIDDPKIAIQCIQELSKASGTLGMIGGQVLDMDGEKISKPSLLDLEAIHNRKTGALLKASMKLGAITAQASPEQLNQVSKIGLKIGHLFQLADDILDIESSTEDLGKTAGKDSEANKITYPRVMGLDATKDYAEQELIEILSLLKEFGTKGNTLIQIAEYILRRKN